MRVPEILAPAGSMESLIAALRCGADAVYVGGKQFSARQSAANFDLEELRQAADLCHLFGAKLYLTVNTVLLDEELAGFAAYIEAAADIGVDACIVQDLGAAKCIAAHVPQMPLHASTQMTIHTPEGALWAKEHGFRRVVVARELSRNEIKPILATGIEVEQFVHGALCMSISGQCYLSAMIGSRSANRGRCAQACRLPFSACGKNDACALSLKDLSLVEAMPALMEDGVASLKIEGRMKRPEYVAAAVTALRQARNGEKPDISSLRAVFSRSGFTDGYYTGQRQGLFGVREKDDVTAAKDVLPELAQLYRKVPQFVPLDVSVLLHAEMPAELTATDGDGNTVTILGDVPQPALTRPTDEAQLLRQLSKLGDTIYALRSLKADCDGTSMLPSSALNALRRTAIEKLDACRIKKNAPVYTIASPADEVRPDMHIPRRKKNVPLLHFRVRTARQLHALGLLPEEFCIVPLTLAEQISPSAQYLLQAPRFTPHESALRTQLAALKEKGFSHLLCENPAHIRIGNALGFTLHGGMDLHVLNEKTVQVLQKDGLHSLLLSPEVTLAQAQRMHTDVPLGIYAYGKLPVMLMRCCPMQNEVSCKNCTGALIDRTKRRLPVLCQEKKEYTELLNPHPVWMADRLCETDFADFLLLDFTDKADTAEIRSIAQAYRTGSKEKPAQITRGLLYRGIQG